MTNEQIIAQLASLIDECISSRFGDVFRQFFWEILTELDKFPAADGFLFLQQKTKAVTAIL